jgi:hypothetical protein
VEIVSLKVATRRLLFAEAGLSKMDRLCRKSKEVWEKQAAARSKKELDKQLKTSHSNNLSLAIDSRNYRQEDFHYHKSKLLVI